MIREPKQVDLQEPDHRVSTAAAMPTSFARIEYALGITQTYQNQTTVLFVPEWIWSKQSYWSKELEYFLVCSVITERCSMASHFHFAP